MAANDVMREDVQRAIELLKTIDPKKPFAFNQELFDVLQRIKGVSRPDGGEVAGYMQPKDLAWLQSGERAHATIWSRPDSMREDGAVAGNVPLYIRAGGGEVAVAYVPIHPRNGPLWANTVPTLESERPSHYPTMPLYTRPAPPAVVVEAPYAYVDNHEGSILFNKEGAPSAITQQRIDCGLLTPLYRLTANAEVKAQEEFGWVLEKGTASAPQYLTATAIGLEWTYSAAKALRLSRRSDADTLAELAEDTERVAEHCWPTPPAAAKGDL